MRLLKRLFSPLVTFICIQLVWVVLLVFWISWFIGRHEEFRSLAELYRPELLSRGFDWVALTEGIILLVVVLVGVYVIFIFWRRQSALYQQQRNSISQVAHELKSPLASIQLHLETIRLRKPSPEKMDRFLDTMLADTERLNHLIDNLLIAARLEKRRRRTQYPPVDFSGFVRRSLEQKVARVPEGGHVSVDVEEGIIVAIDTEEMEMVLKNLFENAVIYSSASPDIHVSLRREGRNCLLVFSDRGRGLERKELKKIFRMFYRVRRPGENIRGTGLGLYIVSSVVQDHGGRIVARSEGVGKGAAFAITLPMTQQKELPDA